MITIGSSIYDLAQLAVTKFGLKGIDWATLAAAGRSSIWDRDYINNYMAPADAAMIANIGGMTFDAAVDAPATQQAFNSNAALLQSLANSLMPLFNLPSPQLVTVAVGLERDAVRRLTSLAYQSAQYAFLLHADETVQHSGMSDAEVAAHANTCVGVMNALVMLRNLKIYEALGIDESDPTPPPPASSTQGLGIAPAVVVIAIAAMAILAWLIISVYDLNSKNKIVAQVCANAQAAGDAAATSQCITTLTDPNKNAGTMPLTMIEDFIKSLLPYALGAAAIYALFLSAPYIVKNLLTKKATA